VSVTGVLRVDNACVRAGQPFLVTLRLTNNGNSAVNVAGVIPTTPPASPVILGTPSRGVYTIPAGESRETSWQGVVFGAEIENYELHGIATLDDGTDIVPPNVPVVRIIPQVSEETMPLPYGETRFDTNLESALAGAL
jgi:hypothetical protein